MKQKLLATLTFGATLLAGGGLVLADETAEVAQPEAKPVQAEDNKSENTKAETSASTQTTTATPKASEDKNQEIQGQIDQEKEHMEQDKTQVGQLEDENKDLQDQIDSNSDKKDQEISAVDETANEEIKDSQDKLDKIEQDQIQSEKDKIQSEIDKTEDQLEDTKEEIADKEGILQEKQDELDKLEDQNQANSVMGSLVNNDTIGSHDKVPALERIPGTDKVEDYTEDYLKDSQTQGEWYKNNKGKEEINNKELTQEQAWELNLYLMERINAARREAGQKEFIVTKDMFDKVYQRAESAKDNFNHDMNDINSVFGSNWAGENLGYAGSYQDYASLINSSLMTIDTMMNNDGGEDHWGHRDNFLRDYYKDWGNVEAAFAFVWSDKYNRWVMVFDVMKYDGGTNHAHDLDNKYSGNSNQDKINELKKEISDMKNQISDLKQKENDLENQISDLENQKENVKFDYNKLDDSEKLDYIAHSQNVEQTKEWQQEKIQEIEDKYTEINDGLYQQIDNNKKQINQLKDEIKNHQDKIAELEGQLEQEKPETPSEPEEKPEEPSTPEEKPDMPNKGDGAGNTTPSIDDENSPESPATEDPTHPDEEPSEPEEDNSVPMTPLEPSTPVEPETKPEGTPNTPNDGTEEQPTISDELEDSKPETKPNNGWNPNFKDPSDIIETTQGEATVSHNGTSYEPVHLSKGDVTAYVPTQAQPARTMKPSNNDYHFVGEAEAAEINAPVETATRMTRLHGELPQTGSEDHQSMIATGAALVTLSSLFGLSALRRRKEQE